MAHVHNTDVDTKAIKIQISKLAKGDHAVCPEESLVSAEVVEQIQTVVAELLFESGVCEQIEQVVRELLGDPNLIIEVTQE